MTHNLCVTRGYIGCYGSVNEGHLIQPGAVKEFSFRCPVLKMQASCRWKPEGQCCNFRASKAYRWNSRDYSQSRKSQRPLRSICHSYANAMLFLMITFKRT